MATNDSTPKTVAIQLTKGQVAIVDECDGDLAQFKWTAAFHKKYGGGGDWTAHRTVTIAPKKRRLEIMHRVIMERVLDRPLLSTEYVDHEDLNPLNNRRDNLRLANPQESAFNRRKPKSNSSGFKGVTLERNSGLKKRWRAAIGVDGMTIHLGRYETAEEAFEAYCAAAKRYHHEFARFE